MYMDDYHDVSKLQSSPSHQQTIKLPRLVCQVPRQVRSATPQVQLPPSMPPQAGVLRHGGGRLDDQYSE